MKSLLVLIVLLTTLYENVQSYTWGVPDTACDFFTPSHIGRNRKPAEDYYKLSSKKMMFSPGETIEIKVMGRYLRSKYTYTGFLMSVRKDQESFGTWEESFDHEHINCNRKIGSAIADSNQFPRVVGQDVYRWTAPDECEYDQMYYVSATIVKSKREFLDGLMLPLKCVHKSKNVDDSCSRQFYAIPEGANTSFELDNPGNWTDDKNSKIPWTWRTGSTPSPGTGPKNANDGNYYLYMEASFPSRRGQKAILVSPPGLSGCLCFRFAYHMYTDEDVKFYCSVNGKNVPCQHPEYSYENENSAPLDTRRDKWINSWISINEPGNVEIKIIGQRGNTFRGDIGLDNFTFTPGVCIEDEKIDLNFE
ncbi:uncharacterized protein LOC120331887 [Styela clava]